MEKLILYPDQFQNLIIIIIQVYFRFIINRMFLIQFAPPKNFMNIHPNFLSNPI